MMKLKDYKEYLIFFFQTIEDHPDDEVSISIEEIYKYCKRAHDYKLGV